MKGAFPNGPTPLIQLVDTSAFTILPHKSTRGHGTSHHRDLVDNRCSRVLGESHKKPNAPGTKSLSMVPRISCRAAALGTALHGADAVSKTDVMSCGKRSVSTTRKTKKQREREREGEHLTADRHQIAEALCRQSRSTYNPEVLGFKYLYK